MTGPSSEGSEKAGGCAQAAALAEKIQGADRVCHAVFAAKSIGEKRTAPGIGRGPLWVLYSTHGQLFCGNKKTSEQSELCSDVELMVGIEPTTAGCW
mgnify:CR=1 FL=1